MLKLSRLAAVCVGLTLTASAWAAGLPHVELTTNLGTIELELYPEKAPQTVANFERYVREGHYNGTIFHRVISGFMVQGGGFDAAMREKKTYKPVPNEAANGLKNEIGTLAMAHTADPHSASAQFFINVADNAFLNYRAATVQGYGYTVFGRVVRGMDVVNRIAQTRTAPGDTPIEPIRIDKASYKAN